MLLSDVIIVLSRPGDYEGFFAKKGAARYCIFWKN